VANIKIKGHFLQKLLPGHRLTQWTDRSTWTTKVVDNNIYTQSFCRRMSREVSPCYKAHDMAHGWMMMMMMMNVYQKIAVPLGGTGSPDLPKIGLIS